jgi:hypothetical protein
MYFLFCFFFLKKLFNEVVFVINQRESESSPMDSNGLNGDAFDSNEMKMSDENGKTGIDEQPNHIRRPKHDLVSISSTLYARVFHTNFGGFF